MNAQQIIDFLDGYKGFGPWWDDIRWDDKQAILVALDAELQPKPPTQSGGDFDKEMSELCKAWAENTALRKRVAELEEWKSNEQKNLISIAVELLEAGCKGPSVIDGVKQLKQELSSLRQSHAELVEALNRLIECDNRGELHRDPLDTDLDFRFARKALTTATALRKEP